MHVMTVRWKHREKLTGIVLARCDVFSNCLYIHIHIDREVSHLSKKKFVVKSHRFFFLSTRSPSMLSIINVRVRRGVNCLSSVK